MKIYYDYAGQYPQNKKSLELSVGLKDTINLLIIIHLIAFILYMVIGWKGLLEQPLANGTVDDYIRYFLAISSRTEDIQSQWSTSIFTYQFVHFSMGELLLNMSMLWLFGHILQDRIGQLKVVGFYFILVTISAIVFNVSHLIFPVYSGPGGIMEGAFGGVLGVMTTTVFFYGKRIFYINKHIRFQLWQVYMTAILLSFLLVYKNNIAYILVYIFSIYAGMRYAVAINENETERYA